MITLTLTQLRDRFAAISHATPVTLTLSTLPKVRENPFEKIHKLSTINGIILFDYSASMERATQAPFTRAPRSWGEWYTDALVRHSKGGVDLFYLCTRVRHRAELMYHVKMKNGATRFVRKSEIEPYLVPSREQDVPYREIRLDSILRVKMNRERFAIVP